MTFWEIAGSALALLAAYFFGGWLLSVKLRDVSIVDVMWGPGFFLVVGLSAILGAGHPVRARLVVALVGLWSCRLAGYIFRRNRGRGEDPRYRAMRERRGASFVWVSALTVFGLQAAILFFVSFPVVAAVANSNAPALGWLDALGVAIFLVGFSFEAIADEQLYRWRADPANRGQVCDVGLWRYSRHPNYFGEATLWWGLYLIALAVPGGAWTLGSPLLMTFLLLRVSGVTLLERGLTATKPGYRDYVARTSAFLPWFPRRTAAH